MFSLFSSKKKYLGLDIGNSGIKVVELARQGRRPKLSTYGYAEVALRATGAMPESEEHKVAAMVKKVVSEANISTRHVIAALPAFSVFSSIISLPNMSKRELAQAIPWEAKKFVPLPIEDMVLDWRQLDGDKDDKAKIKKHQRKKKKNQAGDLSEVDKAATLAEIGETAKGGDNSDKIIDPSKNAAAAARNLGLNPTDKEDGSEDVQVGAEVKDADRQRVLVTAAPRDLVNRYLRICEEAELELLALETESFALERSLVGRDPAVIMIVDLGSFSADISIVEDGIPIISRSVDVGGQTITDMIAKSLRVDGRRAEQFKRDIGFSDQEIGSVPKTIESTINPIINEIKYSFDLYMGRYRERSVEKIILTGGSSALPGLVAYLREILNIKVFIGDPWARVIYPVELKPALQEIGPRMAVAVGLAMRNIG